jgi:predicted RNA-binding protein with PIN domain
VQRLVVDGYNVIHAWKDLRGLLRVSLEEARDVLIQRLGTYSLVSGLDVTVVFDAHRARDRRDSAEDREGVHVIFAGGRSADHVIERIAYAARENSDPILVATSDRFQRDLVRGMGAGVVNALELERQVGEAEAELQRRVSGYGR